MPDLAFLSRRFALGICPTSHFCHSVLLSAYARPRVSVAAFCPRHMPVTAFLSRRFALSSCLALHFYHSVLPSAYARPRISVAAFCLRFTPAVCRMATNRTACGMLRSYSAGRDRHLCVLAVLARLSALVGSLRVWAFLCGDLDGVAGVRGTGNGAGGAAFVRFCASTLAL